MVSSQKKQKKEKSRFKKFVNKYEYWILLIGCLMAMFIAGVIAGTMIANAFSSYKAQQVDDVSVEAPISYVDYKMAAQFVSLDAQAFSIYEDVSAKETQEEYIGYTEEDVLVLAKLLYGEAGSISSDTEKAAVIWCVLNRVDSESFPDDIKSVVTQKSQFVGYSTSNPVKEDLVKIVKDVLGRWQSEKNGTGFGRVLPEDYLYFIGDGTHNNFSKEWKSRSYYDWSLDSPYED